MIEVLSFQNTRLPRIKNISHISVKSGFKKNPFYFKMGHPFRTSQNSQTLNTQWEETSNSTMNILL